MPRRTRNKSIDGKCIADMDKLLNKGSSVADEIVYRNYHRYHSDIKQLLIAQMLSSNVIGF